MIKEKKGNIISAKQLYKKACLLGDNHSCNKLEDVLGSRINVIQNERVLNEAISACTRSTHGGIMCLELDFTMKVKMSQIKLEISLKKRVKENKVKVVNI